jgi:hypothetical protein
MVTRNSYSASLGILLAVFVYTGNDVNAAMTEPRQGEALPQPGVDLKPGEVVRIVINALSHNDTPFTDAGIITAFNFASPSNKASTGPLKRFVTMVNSGYGLMLDHVSSEFSEVVFKDSAAYQVVKLIAYDGTEVVYAFRLSLQQEGEYEGMWMTDAVWEISTQRSY